MYSVKLFLVCYFKVSGANVQPFLIIISAGIISLPVLPYPVYNSSE
jgi:hypothetical protein